MADTHDVMKKFAAATADLKSFVKSESDRSEVFKPLIKCLYDLAQQYPGIGKSKHIPIKGLPKLIIKGFDDEQIWQQLEFQNSAIPYYNKYIKNFKFEDASFGTCFSKIKNKESKYSAANEEYAFDGSDTDDSDNAKINAYQEENETFKYRVPGRKSIVDDQFFRLAEMEEFVKAEELRDDRNKEHTSEGSDDMNLFQDIPSEDELDLNDMTDLPKSEHNGKKSARDLMYKDYFGPLRDYDDLEENYNFEDQTEKDGIDNDPDFSENKMENDPDCLGNNEEFNGTKKNLMESDEESSPEIGKSMVKTPFEMQQEKEQQRMRVLEKSLLKDKPWQYTGEVAAGSRPKDSLCNQNPVIDFGRKKNYGVTEEYNEELEKYILDVYLNRNFHDRERKEKPSDINKSSADNSSKATVELDHSKSKKSLAEVYEDQYMKNTPEEEEEEEDENIVTKFEKDFFLIDCMINPLCHQPPPRVPDFKRPKDKKNVPVTLLEDVGPVTISDASTLAPEQLQRKRWDLEMAKEERTDTDKKRERRKKKKFQKFQHLHEEEKLKRDASSSSYAAKKLAKSVALRKVKQHRNTTIVDNSKGEKIKSSKDFYSRLQDTVSAEMASKKSSNDKKRKRM